MPKLSLHVYKRSSDFQGYGGIGQWKFIKSVLKSIDLGVIRQKLYFS